MGKIGTTHLFDVEFEIGDMHMVGNTPYGQRAIANIAGGTFSGARLRGRVLPGGGDWGLFGSDGTLSVDARSCLETDDPALICVTYGGRWRISPELLVRLSDPEQIDRVDPSDYYLRTLLLFETAAEKYAWLNDIVAVGVGRRTVKGIAYSVHEVLQQLIRRSTRIRYQAKVRLCLNPVISRRALSEILSGALPGFDGAPDPAGVWPH